MKTFASKEKQAAPAGRKTGPYVHHPMGPVQQAQQAEVRHILRSTGAQARLTIGQSNDKYEQEADRIADQVMRMPDPKLQRQPENEEEEEMLQPKPLADQITPLVQRQEEPSEEEEEPVQAESKVGERPAVTPSLEARINSLKGGGQPLDASTRAFFEPRFGYDFSHVRMHEDTTAAETAQAINSRAFTLGHHVVMSAGEYQPNSDAGRQLLGHELTHVIQQSGKPTLQKQDNSYIQCQADITKAPSGLPCTLKTGSGHTPGVDILFSVGKKTITPVDKVKLDAFANMWISNGASATVFVDGYSSTDGPQRGNWRLSCKRAGAIKNYLVTKHVTSSKIIIIAHGESTEFSNSDKKENRRVVVSSLPMATPPAIPTPVPPQPAPLSLKKIKFTSDHGTLKDNNASWSNSGTAVEPEWITNPLRNKSISQTKDTKLVVDITVNIGMPGTNFDLIGTSLNNNDASFKKTGNTSTGTDQVITVTADANIPNAVSQIYRYIVWKIKVGSKEQLIGISGPHNIYVTYGVPSGGVTEKRMAWSCQKASGENIPGKIADKIGPEATSSSHFGGNFNLSNPWTALATNGDCGTLSTLMKQSLEILGVTGAQIRFVYARHSNWTNLWTISSSSNETNSSGDKLGFISGVWNNYEGTCYFNSKWWMGGAGDFKLTPLGVLKRWTWPNNSSTGQRQVWSNNYSIPVTYPSRWIVSVAI